MMQLGVVIPIRVHSGLIIRRVMMKVWMGRLGLMLKVMMEATCSPMIAV
jgi:hypothetical protein